MDISELISQVKDASSVIYKELGADMMNQSMKNLWPLNLEIEKSIMK